MSSPTAQQPHPGRRLNPKDYKTLGLSAMGATLEIYDFVIFLFLITELGQLFFPPSMPAWAVQLQTMGIFAAGFLVRPISGVIIGHFGDKLGRKRMFTFSILLMALPTLCIGLLPTYATVGMAAPLLLLAMRILQGAAIGGEVPGAWVFVAEHVPLKRMGFGLGVLTCGISGGSLLGALIVLGINTGFTDEEIHAYAWRIPFIIGGVFGLIAVYLRRFLSETPVFKEIAAKRKLSKELPLKAVLRDHLPSCALTAVMTWAHASTAIVIILLPPMLLPAMYGIPKSLVFEANCLATVMMVIGNILLGWLSDRVGSRWVILFSFTGVIVSSYYFFSHLAGVSPGQLITNYMFMGFFAGSSVTMPIVAVRVFPTAIRFSGVSFSYNTTFALVGALAPLLITVWMRYDALAAAHYLSIVSVCTIAAGFTALACWGYRHAQAGRQSTQQGMQSML